VSKSEKVSVNGIVKKVSVNGIVMFVSKNRSRILASELARHAASRRRAGKAVNTID
jgi:hypothetical protein